MNKIFSKSPAGIIAAGLITGFIYWGMCTTALAYEFPDYVTVGLRYGNTAVNYAAIDSEQGLLIGTLSQEQFLPDDDLSNLSAVAAVVENGTIVLSSPNGEAIKSFEAGALVCLMATNAEDDGVIRFNNVPYRGGILLEQNSEGKITVINRLGVTAYLYGVLHQEMSQANPIEALKAQAIAARNYIVIRMGAHQKDGFDVCTTTHCQVYKGFSGEYPKILQAVDETADLLMYAQGVPVQAYYHKNSGGYTENSENVWYEALPYLRGIEDPYSPIYTWSAVLTRESIESSLKAGGYEIGTIQRVEIDERTAAGGVLRLEITGNQGEILLEKERIRSVLGATVIKSLNFQLANGEAPVVSLQGDNGQAILAEKISVLSAEGNLIAMSADELFITNGIATIQLPDNAVSEDGFAFSGSGYGHRLGMSQDGAIAMANQGLGYQDILSFYYTNIEIR